MLNFTKSYMDNSENKKEINFNKVNDLKKIEEIRNRLHPMEANKINNQNELYGNERKDIYRERVNQLKAFKKD